MRGLVAVPSLPFCRGGPCCQCTVARCVFGGAQLKRQRRALTEIENRRMEREQRISANLEPRRVSIKAQIEACSSGASMDGSDTDDLLRQCTVEFGRAQQVGLAVMRCRCRYWCAVCMGGPCQLLRGATDIVTGVPCLVPRTRRRRSRSATGCASWRRS